MLDYLRTRAQEMSAMAIRERIGEAAEELGGAWNQSLRRKPACILWLGSGASRKSSIILRRPRFEGRKNCVIY